MCWCVYTYIIMTIIIYSRAKDTSRFPFPHPPHVSDDFKYAIIIFIPSLPDLVVSATTPHRYTLSSPLTAMYVREKNPRNTLRLIHARLV